ncbi:MAG: HD domain-containing protein [Clostridiales bacterium]|nr:HD domain-containing protein [Clostridiales bacterium]
MNEELSAQIKFLIEVDKMKGILRQTLVIDGTRRENDAEHSWHIALMALTLKGCVAFEVNANRAIEMALIHDLVEIYAGDTFAYDKDGYADKEIREREAAQKLFSILPSSQAEEFKSLWEEFEQMLTPEALYAAAVDRLQPFINNCNTNWHTWMHHEVSKEQVLERMAPVAKALPQVWGYVEAELKRAENMGVFSHRIKDFAR